jgi:uncharacterized integral membrane protein
MKVTRGGWRTAGPERPARRADDSGVTDTVRSARLAEVKEVAWAILLIDVMLVLTGLIVSLRYRSWAFWVFVGLAALTTVYIGGTLLVNMAYVRVEEWWRRRLQKRRA